MSFAVYYMVLSAFTSCTVHTTQIQLLSSSRLCYNLIVVLSLVWFISMITMEGEPSELSKLFCPVKNKPMQFAIILENLLNVECMRVLRHIEEKGGEFCGFDPKDSEFIVLASSKYKSSSDQTVFDIKYVKRCVKEKKLLDLDEFQISGKKISGPGCCPFQWLAEPDRCTHFWTAEQVLSEMLRLTGSEPKAERAQTPSKTVVKKVRLRRQTERKAEQQAGLRKSLTQYHLQIKAEVARRLEQERLAALNRE